MAKKVYLDAGHGGKDSGAVGNGLKEKDLTLRIATIAKDYLLANYDNVTVKMSRTGDTYPTLPDRTNDANAWGADIFVSAHINAGGGRGFETYRYSGASDPVTISFQNVLHTEILTAMRAFGDINNHGAGKQAADLHVCRETHMPAILTESLYIDSADANYLKNDAFISAVGRAHAVGVAKFLGLPQKAAQPAPAPLNGNVGKLVVVDFDGLNVRNKPSWDDSAVEKQVRKGEAFTILEELDEFYRCKYFYITKSTKYVHVK